ncbi:pilin [Francisella philomiragia]|uniref:pilin n=1 Tax=Francisella philomiragia TaxID=28110 RepID=UPI001C9E163E|nr:pilin [Francisella philomiragia]MBY7733702.1 pilin [Francisella philomiragia]
MKKNSRGFSLLEILVVIVIIVILAAVAIPAYANYQVRSNIISEIGKLGSIKAAAAEYTSNNNGSLDYTESDLPTLPSGASIGAGGALILDTSDIVPNSSISLTPSINSGSTILWTCSGTGLNNSQLPNTCQPNSSSSVENNTGASTDNSQSSNGYDSNLLETSSYRSSTNLPCVDGHSCYIYDGDTYIDTNPTGEGSFTATSQDGFSISSLTGADGIQYIDNNDNIVNLTTADDFDNADLSDSQRQMILNTIGSLNDSGYCGQANSSDWMCTYNQ